MKISRRKFVASAAGLGLSTAMPLKVRAADGPIRIGLLTVKTGALASGGIDMERALVMYLKERNYMMAGRKIELVIGDTAGVPATARTKTQEMVEKDNVDCLMARLPRSRHWRSTTISVRTRFRRFRLPPPKT